MSDVKKTIYAENNADTFNRIARDKDQNQNSERFKKKDPDGRKWDITNYKVHYCDIDCKMKLYLNGAEVDLPNNTRERFATHVNGAA